MKYRYTLVYWIKGLDFPPQDNHIHVLTDNSVNLTAIITDSVDVEVDKKTALANLALQGMLGGSEDDFDTRLSKELASIKKHRSTKYPPSACFLSISTEGNIGGHLSLTEHKKSLIIFQSALLTWTQSKSTQLAWTKSKSTHQYQTKSQLSSHL